MKFFNPKFLLLALIVCGVTFGGLEAGLATNTTQALTLAVFSSVISTTLLFWERRVGVAFIGVALLVACKAMTLKSIILGAELDIILFLVGMMIIVGVLKDLGFLTWIIQAIISRKRMTGVSFTAILCVLSALLASVVDEVSSIVVVLALVFQVCDTLKLRPHPFVLIAVMATNIGSSATMLGNPVGIYIGSHAGFTFSQFLVGATPVAFVALVCTFAITVFWFRNAIQEMSKAMENHRKLGLGPTAKIPYKAGLFVLLTTVVVIAFHHQIEGVLGLMGAVIYCLIRHRGRVGGLSLRRVFLAVFLTLYMGFTNSGVNNAAHIGGLICGFVLAVLFYHPKENRSQYDLQTG